MPAIHIGGKRPPKRSPIARTVYSTSQIGTSGSGSLEIVERLAAWRSLLGIERILFASDQVSGPRFTGGRSSLGKWVAFFRDLPAIAQAAGYRFTANEAWRILGRNAQDFYGLA